jgi:hypothetical protein
MENSDAIKYLIQYFLRLSIIIFVVVYSIWFLLTPLEYYPYGNFSAGLIAFLIFAVFSGLSWITKSRSCLGTVFLIFAVSFWLINFWITINTFPSIEAVNYRNGTIYVLTYSHDLLEPQYDGFDITRWKWGLLPEMAGLPGAGGFKFVYDEQSKVAGIVQGSGGTEWLIYTDDGKEPRGYYSGLKYDGYLYYLSDDCLSLTKKEYGYSCDSYKYTIYQCALDNTSCIALPMQYIGTEQGGNLELNNSTGDLEFSVGYYSKTWKYVYSLVYSYGDHPRCYVEGCEIIEQP